ncbi:putative tubulin polyglutamylase TTLL9 isoform X1 [Labeo rohita]|uniref:Tubulin--tyrosine ligase-like protein 9 n=1 Tax=Labeo rohita TaxID=84645 RepID=A0A498LWT9_LABRO|nr:putative tubulin polyglutamylase TTLL9 isoform X1 [Labeo rohita]RXN30925.1 putative tubulin polyglutamylase TTLL9 isoform X1 [Labeo rohita]
MPKIKVHICSVCRRTVPYGMSSYRSPQRLKRSSGTDGTVLHRCTCADHSDSQCYNFCNARRDEGGKMYRPGHWPWLDSYREGRSCIRYRCGLTNTIQDVLNQRPGWVEVKDDGDWDFNWCDVGWLRENFDHSYMEEHVRICHFRNHYELTRKNLMVKNLKRYRKTLEREAGRLEAAKCDFFPCTFVLPSEYHIFVEEFKRSPGSTWIMKPVARSQGKGIFLFRKLKDIIDWKKDGSRSEEQKDEAQVESYVAQRYIENPYLIAVQKTAPDYDPEKGCKWQMQQLRQYLTAKHGFETVQTLFKEIDNIFIRSLLSVQKTIINDKHCFELYGYDILLDQDLKP